MIRNNPFIKKGPSKNKTPLYFQKQTHKEIFIGLKKIIYLGSALSDFTLWSTFVATFLPNSSATSLSVRK